MSRNTFPVGFRDVILDAHQSLVLAVALCLLPGCQLAAGGNHGPTSANMHARHKQFITSSCFLTSQTLLKLLKTCVCIELEILFRHAHWYYFHAVSALRTARNMDTRTGLKWAASGPGNTLRAAVWDSAEAPFLCFWQSVPLPLLGSFPSWVISVSARSADIHTPVHFSLSVHACLGESPKYCNTE